MMDIMLLQPGVAIAYGAAAVLLVLRPRWGWADRLAVPMATVGVCLHLLVVLIRGLDSGQIPIVTRYEDFTVDALAIALIYLVAQWRWPATRQAGVIIMPLAAVLVVAALTYSRGVFPMSPALRTNWLVIHAQLNSFAIGFGTLAVAVGLLPQTQHIPALVGRLLAWTFILWSGMVGAGSYWASLSWGRYWAWDPIELWSLISWLLYGLVLHTRMTWKLSQRSLCWMTIAAALTVVFALWGVGYIYETIHEYG